jgi:hypothetical protein
VTPRPGGRLVSRTMLILLVAAAGVVLGGQSGFFVARIGWEAYITALLLVALGLAALARPRRR